jgi:hypothetical protein
MSIFMVFGLGWRVGVLVEKTVVVSRCHSERSEESQTARAENVVDAFEAPLRTTSARFSVSDPSLRSE